MRFKEALTNIMNFIFGTFNLLKEKIIMSVNGTDDDQLESQDDPTPPGNGTLFKDLGLVMAVFGVCLAGVSATIQALQSSKPIHASSQLVHLALVIFFTAILVSINIRPNHHGASEMAMHLGVFFGTTALMVGLIINLSTPLVIVSVAVCFIGLLIIVIFKIMFKPT